MTRVGVYILTTGAPIRIEAIHARRLPPRSEITVGQDYSQRLPATKDYDAQGDVGLSGILNGPNSSLHEGRRRRSEKGS